MDNKETEKDQRVRPIERLCTHYTPRELLGLKPIDPACGTGGFLAFILGNPPWQPKHDA
jgi:hypothetical protein